MGGKKTDTIHFKADGGVEINIPSAVVVGDAEGPEAVITAGIHGREYSGIFAAIKLFRAISPSDIKGSVKFITVSDTEAFERREGWAGDKEDLNRSFPGMANKSHSLALAARLFDEIKGADYHMDLHGGDWETASAPIAFYHRGRRGDLNDASHEIAYYYGLSNIVITEAEGRWQDKGTCYSSVYEQIGIPSAILQTDDVNRHIAGMMNVLKKFGTLKGSAELTGRPQIHENMELVYTKSKGVFHWVSSLEDKVRRGQMIGYLTDYFGTPVEKVIAPVSGRILFMSRNASMPERGFVAAIGVSGR